MKYPIGIQTFSQIRENGYVYRGQDRPYLPVGE